MSVHFGLLYTQITTFLTPCIPKPVATIYFFTYEDASLNFTLMFSIKTIILLDIYDFNNFVVLEITLQLFQFFFHLSFSLYFGLKGKNKTRIYMFC